MANVSCTCSICFRFYERVGTVADDDKADSKFIGLILSHLIQPDCNLIIDFAGIPQGADPATVAAESVERFGWALGPAVIFMTAIAIFCISFYNISRERHGEILAELRAGQSTNG